VTSAPILNCCLTTNVLKLAQVHISHRIINARNVIHNVLNAEMKLIFALHVQLGFSKKELLVYKNVALTSMWQIAQLKNV